jgi:hypothetical protein
MFKMLESLTKAATALRQERDALEARYMALLKAVADGRAMQPAPPLLVDLGPNVRVNLTEGELWSWVRSVMSQGVDIRCDYEQGVHKGYEAYSARLDAAAAERAEELWARLKTPNAELSGAGHGAATEPGSSPASA